MGYLPITLPSSGDHTEPPSKERFGNIELIDLEDSVEIKDSEKLDSERTDSKRVRGEITSDKKDTSRTSKNKLTYVQALRGRT